jgi:hypothetical protein
MDAVVVEAMVRMVDTHMHRPRKEKNGRVDGEWSWGELDLLESSVELKGTQMHLNFVRN